MEQEEKKQKSQAAENQEETPEKRGKKSWRIFP